MSKKNKAVNLFSTVHYSKNCVGEMQKPEAILFYNANKSGVDCMDQMVTHFTTKRPTKRWTLAFFFNMLDVMALAAFVACKEIDGNYKHDGRRKFLNMLANTMVLANTENRMNQISVVTQFSTQMAMVGFYGRRIDLPTNVVTEHNCEWCQYTNNTKRFSDLSARMRKTTP